MAIKKKLGALANIPKPVLIGAGIVGLLLLTKKSKGAPDTSKPDPQDYTLPNSQTYYDGLIAKLYQLLSGYSIWGDAAQYFDELYNLTDSEIKYVYKLWNNYYFNERGTLTQDIDSEWTGWSNTSDYAISQARIVTKLKSLGLP